MMTIAAYGCLEADHKKSVGVNLLMLAALLATVAAVPTVLADIFSIREPSSIKHIHILLHELGINLFAASLFRGVIAVLRTVGDAKAPSSPLILVAGFRAWPL